MMYQIGCNDFSKQNYSLKEAMAYIFNPCEHNNHKEYGRFILYTSYFESYICLFELK